MSIQSKQATIIDAGEGAKLNILGHAVTVMLTSAETNGDGYLFEVITPAGHGIPPHVHEREDEYIYIAEGVYEVFLNGRTHKAKSGAMLHFPRYIPHGFRNIGATPGKTVWTVTPGANFEPFFNELGALPADAPPDMQKVVGIFAKYGMEVLPPPGL
jgi:quercetin dioxygenase-like cupin family protein